MLTFLQTKGKQTLLLLMGHCASICTCLSACLCLLVYLMQCPSPRAHTPPHPTWRHSSVSPRALPLSAAGTDGRQPSGASQDTGSSCQASQSHPSPRTLGQAPSYTPHTVASLGPWCCKKRQTVFWDWWAWRSGVDNSVLLLRIKTTGLWWVWDYELRTSEFYYGGLLMTIMQFRLTICLKS